VEKSMPKEPVPLRSDEPPQLPGPEPPPLKDLPEQPDIEPVEFPERDPVEPTLHDSVPVRPAARQNEAKRRMDRYDIIGAALVAFIVALWVIHFLLPAPPPDAAIGGPP
jgi:hypothetical protein